MSLMIEEIRQQPEVLQALLDRPPTALAQLRKRFSRQRPGLIVIVARGTSDNAALFARYLFEITLGIPTSLAAPSIATLYRRLTLPDQTLVIGISQSGESTDINSFLETSQNSGAFTIGITNEPASTLAGLADEVLPVGAGKEASVAATKTYTSQMMVLYCLAQSLGAAIHSSDLNELPAMVAKQLEGEASVRDLARQYRAMSHAVVVGRGFNYANGLEFALKLMETCYVVATGFSGADFAHGPIAMVEKGFPAFVFTPPGPTFEQTEKLVARLAESGVNTVCIGHETIVNTPQCDGQLLVRGDPITPTGVPDDTFTPIPSIIPAQLFAGHLSECKGLNPDRPRMLSKVTHTL